jgi:glycosyltransferase involved in cell wall biosynthesis
VLVVFGPGNPPVQDAAQQGVEFRGVIPFGEAQRFVCGYDVLVLPSLHDGWGVVVNEALLQGVPVIVSDAVGARTLVEKSGAGHVFQAGEAESLARALVALCDNPVLLGQWRDAAEDFRQQLSPEVAAKYLYDCMRFVSGLTQCRPCAPWYV